MKGDTKLNTNLSIIKDNEDVVDRYRPEATSPVTIKEMREFKVVKSNEIIQKARFSLSTKEQKILLYLISKIKPEDTDFNEIKFNISEFCKVCGIDERSGGNYTEIRNAIQTLADKSIWVVNEKGEYVLLRWLNEATVSPNAGNINLSFSEKMKPYLLNLSSHFTQYELLYTLALSGQYSLRLYEYFKSFQFKKYTQISIADLRIQLMVDEYVKGKLKINKYPRFSEFRRFVLDSAISEINEYTDINVSYTLSKTGRSYTHITFYINAGVEDSFEKLRLQDKITAKLNRPKQISLSDIDGSDVEYKENFDIVHSWE